MNSDRALAVQLIWFHDLRPYLFPFFKFIFNQVDVIFIVKYYEPVKCSLVPLRRLKRTSVALKYSQHLHDSTGAPLPPRIWKISQKSTGKILLKKMKT